MTYEYTPENIRSLEPGQIFVFGSNSAGRHGLGAAKQAVKFGAEYGKGEGHYGSTYAIPTKEWNMEVSTIDRIRGRVDTFLKYAEENPELTFLVTKIGCGLAGYDVEDIAEVFGYRTMYLENVILPEEFDNIIFKI